MNALQNRLYAVKLDLNRVQLNLHLAEKDIDHLSRPAVREEADTTEVHLQGAQEG